MKVRSLTVADDGQVSVAWESESGSVCKVTHAYPRPHEALVDAMRGVIPQVCAWRKEPDAEGRMYLRGFSMVEREVNLKGEMATVTIVKFAVCETCEGSDKPAQVRFPALTEEIELPGQTVMWPDMRQAVNTLVDQAEAYCKSVKEAL